ncbi:copper chaperone CopZ [mine drainage metagenome]|uniref:Copper chaperone CopZ n=1 Tax=mine drainage metagenome TaxID=410659 RepID=A0A1J5QIG9_9ZZZZ
MDMVTLQIAGMACGGCANTVKQALLELPGVAGAEVSHADASAIVSYDPDRVTLEQMRNAIVSAGYQVGA